MELRSLLQYFALNSLLCSFFLVLSGKEHSLCIILDVCQKKRFHQLSAILNGYVAILKPIMDEKLNFPLNVLYVGVVLSVYL